MDQRIVPISLPQPAIIGLLIFFFKSSYSSQENNNLRNKMIQRTYHEGLSTVVHELLHPFLAMLTPHVRRYKQLHWARLTSKRRSDTIQERSNSDFDVKCATIQYYGNNHNSQSDRGIELKFTWSLMTCCPT